MYVTLPGETHTERVQVGTDRSGHAIFQTVTRQDPPHEEMVGYHDVVLTTVVYEKHLRLTARDNAPAVEGRPPAEVWTVDITSEGESRDLRKTLPVLAAASIEYVGVDSHGEKVIHIKDTDKDVAFVKKGM